VIDPEKLSLSQKTRLKEIDFKINEAHKEIARLHRSLDKLVNDRISILSSKPLKPARPYSVTGVASIELRPLIQEWIDNGNSLVELGRQSGLHETTIRYILNGRTKFTSAINADKILVALNATHVHLTEVTNPHSKQLPITDDCGFTS
jgi:hypothetical protein